LNLPLSLILCSTEIVQKFRKETGGEDGGVIISIPMDAYTQSTSSSGFSRIPT
jgi:hypothetical protein